MRNLLNHSNGAIFSDSERPLTQISSAQWHVARRRLPIGGWRPSPN